MSVTLDTYRPGLDDAEVLGLRARVWGADHPHTAQAFLTWLFQRNPAGPGSGILLRRKDVLIGFAGLSPRRALQGGVRVRVAHGLDFMVDPAATKGLSGAYAVKVADGWAKLAAREGYAFGVNFPNANSYRLLTSPRLGWRRVLAPRLLVRPLPGLRLREGLPRRVPPALAALGGEVLARGLSLYAGLRTGRLRPTAVVDDVAWLDAATVEAPNGIGFVRDAATLRWRYFDHPVYGYRIVTSTSADGCASGLVTSARTLFGVDSTLLVDLVGAPRPDSCAALLARAVTEAAAQGSRIVGALACPGTLLDGALLRAGFLPVPAAINPKPFFMVARPLSHPSEAAMNGAGWDFAWGDMDVV